MFGSDPVEQIRLATKELAAEDRRQWTASARSERVRELLELEERIRAETVRAVGDWDREADRALDGALSPRSWLAHRVPIAKLDASRLVRSARLVREHEATGSALADGDISCAHVEVLAPMIHDREDQYEENEHTLLDAARELPVDEFGLVARYWRSAADDVLSQVDAAALCERRRLHVSTTLHGMGVIEGELDAEGTGRLLQALELACPPDSGERPEPPRSLAQRRADGLVDICTAYVASKGEGGRPDVGFDVTMDLETARGEPPADPRRMRCELSRVGPIPMETAWRLACDCSIGRVIMRGDSEVLDLGRRQRLANRPLRRALEIRDRGCVWPGCDRPAPWCDAHHLIWWEHGGPTSIDNCALMCRRHHMLVHEYGWTIQRAPDGTYHVTEPSPAHVPTRRRRRAPPVAV